MGGLGVLWERSRALGEMPPFAASDHCRNPAEISGTHHRTSPKRANPASKTLPSRASPH